MSLDFSLEKYELVEIAHHNITHNLTDMAKEAGIYECLWRGEGKAKDVIEPLKKGLGKMIADPDYFMQFDSPNGWGLYVDFVPWVREVLQSCINNPEAEIRVSV